MAFHIRDPETDTLVRQFARLKGVGLTEAVKLAVQEQIDHSSDEVKERIARMRAFRAEMSKIPRTGLQADKAFYDSLNDEDD